MSGHSISNEQLCFLLVKVVSPIRNPEKVIGITFDCLLRSVRRMNVALVMRAERGQTSPGQGPKQRQEKHQTQSTAPQAFSANLGAARLLPLGG